MCEWLGCVVVNAKKGKKNRVDVVYVCCVAFRKNLRPSRRAGRCVGVGACVAPAADAAGLPDGHTRTTHKAPAAVRPRFEPNLGRAAASMPRSTARLWPSCLPLSPVLGAASAECAGGPGLTKRRIARGNTHVRAHAFFSLCFIMDASAACAALRTTIDPGRATQSPPLHTHPHPTGSGSWAFVQENRAAADLLPPTYDCCVRSIQSARARARATRTTGTRHTASRSISNDDPAISAAVEAGGLHRGPARPGRGLFVSPRLRLQNTRPCAPPPWVEGSSSGGAPDRPALRRDDDDDDEHRAGPGRGQQQQR